MNCIRILIRCSKILFIPAIIFAQNIYPDLSRFEDSSHHWYTIFDDYRVIEPLSDQPQYEDSQFTKIADNILLFQKNNGGWAKNYDMKAILTSDQIKAVRESKQDENTTFDNGATHSQLTYLAEVYNLTRTEKYKTAFLKGMQFVLEAQYENGGWPQFYPDTSGYREHITFNDMAMVGIMHLFQDIVYSYPQYDFIEYNFRMKIYNAYKKGIECIIKCQIIDNGQKTVWCQQHDHLDYSPRDARTFEKASICNLESAEITEFLMNIQNPDKNIIDAIECAVKWFQKAEIHGIRIQWVESTEEKFLYHTSKYDKIIVNDPDAPVIWARFNELSSHKPIFVSRNGEVSYSLAEIDRDRRTGYRWYTYAPEIVLSLYADWQKKWVD